MNKKLWITCFTSIVITTINLPATASAQQQADSIEQQPLDTNRWSKPATATRRQGDWVPLTVPCLNCHNVLPAVFTPPSQLLKEPRFLVPPPLPPDSLLHQAASGSTVQSFPQPLPQQSTHKQPRQLQQQQQNVNFKHQAEQQYIQQNNQYFQNQHVNQQPQAFQINPLYSQDSIQLATQQQYISNPQLIATSFIQPQQQNVIPQFTSQISSVNVQHQHQEQDQQLLHGNVAIKNNANLPILPNPVLISHQVPTIPSVSSIPKQVVNQHTVQAPQEQKGQEMSQTYQEQLMESTPFVSNSNSNEEKDEVQLLYVPVETLRNRGRHLGRPNQIKQLTEPNVQQVQQTFTNTAYSQQNSKSTYNQNIQEPHFIQQVEPQTQYQKTTNQYQQQDYQEQLPSVEPSYQQQQLQQVEKQPDIYETTPISLRKHRFQKSRQQQAQHHYQHLQQQQQEHQLDLHDTSAQFLPGSSRNIHHEDLYKHQLIPQQPKTNSLHTQNNPLTFNQDSTVPTQKNTGGQLYNDGSLNQTSIPPPHQPPLSVYMETGKNHDTPETLILNLLKNAKTIPVLDSIGPDSPQVFVGPSNLNPPNGYLKFELPYLSSLDSNRVERKVDGLPFFVAPLNFNPPQGYSKIPFPAPHIGSVVVSNATVLKTTLHGKDYNILSTTLAGQPYSNSYALTAAIAPINPQLPSLVNSLQDELFSLPPSTVPTSSTTTTTTSTTTEPVLKITSFRRTHQRGSIRGHSAYTTTTYSPTRRSSSRRRPYSNRQYSSYRQTVRTTTTPEPTTSEQYEQQESVSKAHDDHLLNLQRETTTNIYTQEINTQQYHDNAHQTTNKFISQQLPLTKGELLAAGSQDTGNSDTSYQFSGTNKNQQYQHKEYSTDLNDKQFGEGKFVNSENHESPQVSAVFQTSQIIPPYDVIQSEEFKSHRGSSELKQTNFSPFTTDATVLTSANTKLSQNNDDDIHIAGNSNGDFKNSDDGSRSVYSHDISLPLPMKNDNQQQSNENTQDEVQNQRGNFQQFIYNDSPLQQTQVKSVHENIPTQNFDSIYNVNTHTKRVPIIKYDDAPEQETLTESKFRKTVGNFKTQEEIPAQTMNSETPLSSVQEISQINNFQGVHDESIYDTNRARGNTQFKYSQPLQQQDPSSLTLVNPTGPSLQQDVNENIFQSTKAPVRVKYTETSDTVTDGIMIPSSGPPNYHGIDESIFSQRNNQRPQYTEIQQTTEKPVSVTTQQPYNFYTPRKEGSYRSTRRRNPQRESTSRHQRFRGRGYSQNSYQSTTELIPSTEKQYYKGNQETRYYNNDQQNLKIKNTQSEEMHAQKESDFKSVTQSEQLGSSQVPESGIPIQLQYQQYVNSRKNVNQQNTSFSDALDNLPNEYYTQSSLAEELVTLSFSQPVSEHKVNSQPNEQNVPYALQQSLNQEQPQPQTERYQQNLQSQTDTSIVQLSHINLQANHNTQQKFQHPEVTSPIPHHPTTDGYQRLAVTPTTPVTYFEEKFVGTELPKNQQRFTKYSRTRGRNPIRSSNSEQTQQPSLQGAIQNIDTSVQTIQETATEQTTVHPPYVRVRGRVRGRPRSSTRVTTTTEPPNYPDTIIQSKYKQSQIVDGNRESFGSQRQSGQLHSNGYSRSQNSDYDENLNSKKSVEYSTTGFPDYNIEISTLSSIAKNTLSSTTEVPTVKPSRRYNHILNRNKLKRRPTQTPATSLPHSGGDGNAKYLIKTTHQPPTRIVTGRGRIRRPTTTVSPSTTSLSTTTRQIYNSNFNWVDKENLIGNTAPSAASNEIVDPYYTNKNIQQTYSTPIYQEPVREQTVKSNTKLPTLQDAVSNNQASNDYWNEAVTIQQSTSFDFKPTQSTSESDGSFAAGWNGQIQFQSDYFDAYQQQPQTQITQSRSPAPTEVDQSPFPSNQQHVTYTKVNIQPSARINTHQHTNTQYKSKLHSDDEVDSVSDELNDSEEQIEHASSNHRSNEFHGEDSRFSSQIKIPDTTETQKYLQNTTVPISNDSSEEDKHTEVNTKKKNGRRRGNWVRVRVKKPTDLFETAESQNMPSVSGNAIQYQSTKPVLDNLYWMLQVPTTEPTVTKKADATTKAVYDYSLNNFQYNKGNDSILDASEKTNKTDIDVGTVQEPRETINFEKALSDMMKIFITDSGSNTDQDIERINSTITTVVATTVSEHKETTGQTGDFEDTTLPVTAEINTSLESLTDSVVVNDYFEPTTENTLLTTNSDQELESNPPKILGTSTTTEISLETEICYRGRCVKTKSENDSDLLTTE